MNGESEFLAELKVLEKHLKRQSSKVGVAQCGVYSMAGNRPPWQATEIQVKQGQWYSFLAGGRLGWGNGLGAGVRLHLWGRIGADGHVFNCPGETGTFQAASSGVLNLGILHGFWATREGRLGVPESVYQTLTGSIDVLVVVWEINPLEGLTAVQAAGVNHPILDLEINRLKTPQQPPGGWHYLWELGPTTIFTPGREGGRDLIRVDGRDDMGIIQYPLDLPLEAETRLSWEWRMTHLPGRAAEDTVPTHDYLSIAVEFDNGQDLTWFWSVAMTPGEVFRCPISHWHARETHMVLRSGDEGLEEWHREERKLLEDYKTAIGDPPTRIVAVWLICVSNFGHGHAQGDFASILLDTPTGQVRVV